MSSTIDITDYLTADQNRDICVETVRHDVRVQISSSPVRERLLGNAVYAVVREALEPHMDDDFRADLQSSLRGVITGLSPYAVFDSGTGFRNNPAPGYKHLVAAVDKHQERITNKVAKIIDDLNEYDIQALVLDALKAKLNAPTEATR